jgi:general stress protein CsbA
MHKDKWSSLAYIHTNISLISLNTGLNVYFNMGRVSELILFMIDGEYHYTKSMWGVPLDNLSLVLGVLLLINLHYHLQPRDVYTKGIIFFHV